jgi:hypothetical protein
MRNIYLALAATGLALAGTAPAQAVGTRYPVCIQGNEYPGLSGCTFTSFQQCQATASGRFLTCIANPYYGGGGEPGGYRERRPPPGYPYSRY